MRKNDHHENVIRYYAYENDEEFLYIALELCECTLTEYVENDYAEKWRPPHNAKSQAGRLEITDALYQTIGGLGLGGSNDYF